MTLKKRSNKMVTKQPLTAVIDDDDHEEEKVKEGSDMANICLLMFLYLMQGIPLGLAAAVPYVLQSNSNVADYQSQATFSLAFWPFSLKLAWAPIVDSIYSARIGRRKTWLIPVQYAIGLDLLILASHVDDWFGREAGNAWGALGVTHPVDIFRLTFAFFGLTFLAATQDVVVDGWALTMLSKRNIAWASTCNSVGQMAGYVIAFILFLSLESPDISNTYLRSVPVEGRGIITFSGFLYFWGVAFLVTTTIVAVLKRENSAVRPSSSSRLNCLNDVLKTKPSKVNQNGQDQQNLPSRRIRFNEAISSSLTNIDFVDDYTDDHAEPSLNSDSNPLLLHSANQHLIRVSSSSNTGGGGGGPLNSDTARSDSDERLSLWDTYRVMLGVLRLKPVLQYIGIIFLMKACFSASDSISGLKLIESGVPKERLALIGAVLLPFEAFLPLLITRWTNGPNPLGVYTLAFPIRLLFAGLAIPIVHAAAYFRVEQPASVHANGSDAYANASTPHWSFPLYFYVMLWVQGLIYSLLSHFMFVSLMAFHARISDPSVGGTYMTLLNTAVNLAGSLPSSLMLSLVEPLTFRKCIHFDELQAGRTVWSILHSNNVFLPNDSKLIEFGQQWMDTNATCVASAGMKACQLIGGECFTSFDGFYLEVIICVLLGALTYFPIIRPLTKRLDSLPISAYSFSLSNISSSGNRRREQRKRKQ